MNSMAPRSGAKCPVTMLTKVVLPAPLAPMTPTGSPSSTATLTSRAATTAPKDFSRPRTSRTAAMTGYASFLSAGGASAVRLLLRASTSDHSPLGRNMMMSSSVPPMINCQTPGNWSKA